MKPSHSHSRRQFIARTITGLGALVVPWKSLPSSDSICQPREEVGLFFSREDLPRIRENTQLPLFRELWDSLLHADISADTKFLKEELDIHNHVAHLLRANEILKRSAFVALVGENQQHEDVARLAIEKILSFNEWDYFTEGGTETIGLQRAPETTMAMSFASDWLSDRLPSADKAAMLDAIAQKGVPPCYRTLYGMKHPDRVKGWGFNPTTTYKLRFDLSRWPIILNRTNLKMIPIAGLTIGSVLLYNRHSEAPKWLGLAQESLEDFASLFGKDGSYLEGVSYWSYTALHFTMAVDVLQRLRGVNYNHLINFPGTMRFALQMQMPSRNYPNDVVNFSDASPAADTSHGFWIAREFKDGIAQYSAEFVNTRRNLFALIWYDRSIKAKNPPESMKDVKFDNDWVVSRNGWGIDDTVVAMRSGGPANHEHADRNSVIVKAYGERLLHDPLGAAYPNTEKHWLLRLTEAHTAVLVDGRGHQYHDGHEGTNPSQAKAQIVQFNPGEKITVFTSDATEAYRLVNDDIKKIQRTVVFIKPDAVVLVDEFEKEKNPSVFQARFQAFNADGKAVLVPAPDGKGFEIRRPFAKLSAIVACDTNFRIVQETLDVPREKGIFPFFEVCTDQRRKCSLLTVCTLSPFPSRQEPQVQIATSVDEYQIHFTAATHGGTIRLALRETYPLVQLEE